MTFGGFTFASEVLLGRIAGLYGFLVPEADKQTSLADFVHARLWGRPLVGDYVRVEDIELVVRDMDAGRITKVGLAFEPREPGWGAPAPRPG